MAQRPFGPVEPPPSPAIAAQVDTLIAHLHIYQAHNRADSAALVCQQALEVMAPYKRTDRYAQFIWLYSEILRGLSRHRKAIVLVQEALPVAPSKAWRAKYYNRLGGIYFELDELDSVVLYSRISTRLARQEGLHQTLVWNHWQLGAALGRMGRPEEALTHLHEAIALATPADSANLSMMYIHVAHNLERLQHRPAALQAMKRALELAWRYKVLDQQDYVLSEYYPMAIRAGRTELIEPLVREYARVHEANVVNRSASNLALLEARVKISRQQLENARLARLAADRASTDRAYKLGLAASLALMLIFGVAFQVSRRQRRIIIEKNGLLSHQAQVLETQKGDLQMLNQTKDTLLSVVGHDVRGPLLTLSATLDLLAAGQLTDEERQMMLIGLAGRIRNTEGLLNDVLLWSKGQMRGISVLPAPVRLGPLVQEVIDQTRPQMDARKIAAIVSGAAPTVNADVGLLKVAIRNVLSNAVRYGPEMSTIHIEYLHQGSEAGLAVRDSGPGISSDLALQLNELGGLAQLPGRRELGLGGLGLVLVKDFIERQQGRLHIQTHPGEGTNFAIWLPLA